MIRFSCEWFVCMPDWNASVIIGNETGSCCGSTSQEKQAIN